MLLTELDSKLFTTQQEMHEQTGLLPGGPTGLCHPFIVAFFASHPGHRNDFVIRDARGQERYEIRAGIRRYPVETTRESVLVALTSLLTQPNIGIEAVIASGKLRKVAYSHITATVPIAGGGEAQFGIIDSLSANGVTWLPDVESVRGYYKKLMLPETMSLSSVLTNAEIDKRITDVPYRFRFPIEGGSMMLPPSLQYKPEEYELE